MKIIEGDILKCEENILVHQVNHQGVMGAGLALQVRNSFNTAFIEYANICNNMSWEHIQREGAVLLSNCSVLGKEFYIANLFGQRYYGKYHLEPDYKAMSNGFRTIAMFANRNKLSVAIPYNIGCGFGKGNWAVVSKMIKDIFKEEIEFNIYKI
jgi:O-acetyl-ADP-ribose deacetylase (regulator of RNase III)